MPNCRSHIYYTSTIYFGRLGQQQFTNFYSYVLKSTKEELKEKIISTKKGINFLTKKKFWYQNINKKMHVF